ncbi:MAG: 4-(cytidine 5'-diphospho)-2-C-methyl-D-erythritol kinase, partial [Pseudooceanicola atlanticus]
EVVTPQPTLPPLHAVLVNPGIDIPTPVIFRALTSKTNPPMPEDLPDWPDAAALIDWLHGMRNDLEPPALAQAPEVGAVLDSLRQDKACLLARMSGSGATCFALTDTRQAAEAMADRLSDTGWWVQPVTLA